MARLVDPEEACQQRWLPVLSLLPGVVFNASIAGIAFAFGSITGWHWLSPLILSMLLGMVVRNTLPLPACFAPGTQFALKPLLRTGVVMLGLQVTVDQITSLGSGAIITVVLTLVATFLFIRIIGLLLRVDRALTDLIAAGTAICGASAILAASTVVRARQEHVAYSVACVTLFGTLSMLVYPVLAGPLGLEGSTYGLWAGATIHEVAQVVGTSFQAGDLAGQAGTASKLARVALLAPVILVLSLSMRRSPSTLPVPKVTIPWFVLGFVMMVVFNSAVAIPSSITSAVHMITTLLLATALAAMGLQADVKELRAQGWRPLVTAAFGWIFIALFGYLMLKLLVL